VAKREKEGLTAHIESMHHVPWVLFDYSVKITMGVKTLEPSQFLQKQGITSQFSRQSSRLQVDVTNDLNLGLGTNCNVGLCPLLYDEKEAAAPV
jgi:hypothetical protein